MAFLSARHPSACFRSGLRHAVGRGTAGPIGLVAPTIPITVGEPLPQIHGRGAIDFTVTVVVHAIATFGSVGIHVAPGLITVNLGGETVIVGIDDVLDGRRVCPWRTVGWLLNPARGEQQDYHGLA